MTIMIVFPLWSKIVMTPFWAELKIWPKCPLSMIAVLQVWSLVGVKWKTLAMMKLQNGGALPPPTRRMELRIQPGSNRFAAVVGAETVPVGTRRSQRIGSTVVVGALQHDLTHGDSDWGMSSTRRCRGCGQRGRGRGSASTRRAGFVSLDAVEEFAERLCGEIPRFFRGPPRIAMRWKRSRVRMT